MDPELAAVVAALPPMAAGDPVAARLRMREFLGHLAADAKAAGSDGLTISDRTIPGPPGAPAIRVRLYEPRHRQAIAPCLVYFHGGAFFLGSLDTHDHVARALAKETGHKVISVGYRLAPEAAFPAGLDDCYGVVRWAAEQGTSLGWDGKNLRQFAR